MYVVTVIENGIEITGNRIGQTFQCGLYSCLPYGTIGVKIFPISNPKMISFWTRSYVDFSGAFTATSQADAVQKLSKLLAQNLTIGKVLIDGNDTTPGYLNYKIHAGANVSISIENVDGDEYLLISAGAGAGIASKQVAGNKTTTYNAFLGATGLSILILWFDSQLAPADTWQYNNTTDVLTVGTTTVKIITVLFD